jgi:hypothetical protein
LLLSRFAAKHNDAHFDRLPSCPLCLDKLDTSITGLQQIPKIIKPKKSIDIELKQSRSNMTTNDEE